MNTPRENKTERIEREELAALAGLGLLSSHERARVPADETQRMAVAAAQLGEAATPVAPPVGLRARLMSRVADFQTMNPLADIRSYDGDWINAGTPGVDRRILFKDKVTNRTTMLIRMEPGVRFPSHHHGDDEQCLVLSGDIRWGSLVYEQGDFIVMGRETTHPEIHTVSGNVLMIVAGHNEFVHA